MENKNFNKIILYIILILGFLLRVWKINWGLPYLYNTDEYRVINFALRMGATKSLNPQTFIYPSLYLYFMLFIYTVVFIIGKIFGIYKNAVNFGIKFLQDPTLIYTITRFFSAFFGTCVIYTTYHLAKKIYNEKVGILTSLMLAFLPSFVEYSHYAKIEMFSTFLVTLFAIFLYQFHLSNKITYFYLSCAILGLATSAKYLPVVCSVSMLFVAIYKRLNLKKVLLGFLVMVLFFLLGTPFALIEYKIFLKDILFKHVYGEGMKRYILKSLFLTVKNYFFLGEQFSGAGLIGILGIIFTLVKLSFNEMFLLSLIFGYFVLNSLHYYTSWYFLANSFPFVCILGGRFIEQLVSKYKLIYVVFFLLLIKDLSQSIFINISFSLKDTRTEAVEWIEKNIPFGSKILIDMYTYSPQIKMSKNQLERLYKKAVEINHYKKEYFYYQILAHPGGNYGYEIYQVWRPFNEISTIKYEVEEAQKVRELVDVGKGMDYVKQLGIQYVIINSINYNGYPLNFYKEVQKRGKLLKKFVPVNRFYPGPIIEIYKL